MLGRTPIVDALERHVQRARGAFHVPGHQSGANLPQRLDTWMGQAAKLDLTELPGLDNLMAPTECILESERLAASYYGSARCYYSVNGSSAGIMASFLTLLQPEDTVLLANPFHLSAWYGLTHSGANPVCLPFAYDSDGRQQVPAAEEIRGGLLAHPDARAVYLTSPTYQGDTADVQAIARVAHEFGIPLIVDEAHGAHFGLSPRFPMHSVEAGADIVVQSTHKMLPALTQTAWIHVQGTYVDPDRFAAALNSLQTSSPSYLLMASLDAVQAWLRTDGREAAARTLVRLERHGLVKEKEMDKVNRDPLKHWLPAGPEPSQSLQHQLEQKGIFVEYADATGVLSVLGLDVREQILAEYVEVVKQWQERQRAADGDNERQKQKAAANLNLLAAAAPRQFEMLPRDTWRAHKRRVLLKDSAGSVAATPIAPYPPGVPVVYPGQMLTQPIVHILLRWVEGGQKLQGVNAIGQIEVMK